MATVHMICGYLGVGKTTFARELEERESALRFSADEMYLSLFSQAPTYELDQDAMGRVLAVIEEQWVRAVALGVSVVLDLGFWSRELRERTRRQADALGAPVRLYLLTCSDERALERCLKRNGQEGAFLISAVGYHDLRAHFEAPKDDEGALAIDTEGGSPEGSSRGTPAAPS